MVVLEKNAGNKIPYDVSGTKVTLNDELMINVAKYQRDVDAVIDICANEYGNLIVGIGRYYVAQIDLPAITYTETGEGEEIVRTADPLDMDAITLTLWSVDDWMEVQ